jgi:hypothetical protein
VSGCAATGAKIPGSSASPPPCRRKHRVRRWPPPGPGQCGRGNSFSQPIYRQHRQARDTASPDHTARKNPLRHDATDSSAPGRSTPQADHRPWLPPRLAPAHRAPAHRMTSTRPAYLPRALQCVSCYITRGHINEELCHRNGQAVRQPHGGPYRLRADLCLTGLPQSLFYGPAAPCVISPRRATISVRRHKRD